MRLLFIFLLLVPSFSMAETIQIPGPQGPLEAEVLAPDGARHVVVIIPGSGPTNRDGNSPQTGLVTDTYLLLAERLAEHKIASLRIDKRGFFGSATAITDPNDVTIEAYAEDARNWVQRASLIAPCVSIAGHSEGGLVALVAAQKPPEALCGLMLLASPGRPIGQLMIEQLGSNPANASIMSEVRTIISDLESGKSRDPSTISAILRPMFSSGLQRYMIDLFSYDPKQVAATWPGPTLIVQGDEDIQVRPQDAELLASVLPQAHHINLVGGTHMLKLSVKGNPFATYTDRNLPLHEHLVPGIITFLDATTKPQ